MTDVLIDLARSLMFFLDNVVYSLIPTIYKLFVYLSEVDLFTGNSEINNLINHIYVLLGIFMLFKISFSLLQYIVDPNSFRDSSKGMGKLITNVLVALVLLVSVPSIFSFAMDIQRVIVQTNAIGQLILGDASGSTSSDVTGNMITVEGVNSMARDLQFMLYGTFYSIDENAMKSTAANDSTNGVLSSCNGTSGILGSVDMAYANNGDCLNQFATQLEENDETSANNVTLFSFFKYVNENGELKDEREFEDFGRLLNWKVDGEYVINYLPFISAVVGIYVVFLLISFSVDIAVRAIKLCFLQMVAPIAIISYIDPKESMSNGKLHSWIKECATTYFSLFLRLATIYLVMFVISMIASTVISNGTNIGGLLSQDTGYNIWVYLFLVIGAFMFAKQVPNIIENIFGIKGSGDLNLNPFKNAGFNALAGGAVGLGIGVAGAATGSGIGRIATGTLGGFANGLGGKKINEIANMQADTNRRLGMARSSGSDFFGRMGARFSSTLGTPGALGRTAKSKNELEYEKRKIELGLMDSRRQISLNKATSSSLDALRDRAVKKIQEGRGAQGAHYQELLRNAAEEETKGNGASAESIRQEAQKYLYSDGADSYVTENLNSQDPNADMAIKSLYNTALANAGLSGHASSFTMDGHNLDSLSKQISASVTQLETENIPAEQEIKNLQDKMDVLKDKEQKQRADVEAVRGKEGGPRGRMPGGPRRFGGPRH